MTHSLCFIDLDGVLAAYVEAAFAHYGIKIPWAEVEWDFIAQAGLNPEAFWRSLDFTFWKNVPRSAEFAGIISAAEEKFGRENIFICTSPCQTFGCAAGKAHWVDINLPIGYQRRLMLTNRKEVCSGPGRVLIDDLDENLHKWTVAGGTGVLVPRPWNSTRTPSHDVTDLVVQKIKAL